MSDNMQPIDEILDDESPDAKATEAYEEAEEFDPFEGMSDEELDALCDEDDSLAGFGDVEPGFRSGFVALVGRPNAGKSTLLNACYGKKVAITSPVAQTTRRRMRAVVNRPGYQLVFVDTPGIHKPKDGLGSELNKSALFELNDVDVVAFLIDATKPIGRGDAWVAERVKNARSKKLQFLIFSLYGQPDILMAGRVRPGIVYAAENPLKPWLAHVNRHMVHLLNPYRLPVTEA